MKDVHVIVPATLAKFIAKWASIKRTIQSAEKGVEEAIVGKGVDNTIADELTNTFDELQALEQPLHDLHMIIREAYYKSRE